MGLGFPLRRNWRTARSELRQGRAQSLHTEASISSAVPLAGGSRETESSGAVSATDDCGQTFLAPLHDSHSGMPSPQSHLSLSPNCFFRTHILPQILSPV